MFKKPPTVETKSEKQLSGKDVKALRKELEEKCGDAYHAALSKQMWWRKNRTSSFLFTEEGVAILFSTEGYDGYFPTLHTLWKLDGACLPIVAIHPPVSQFVCRGADLMLPGVRKPFPSVEKHAIVQIQVEGNPKCVAIGRTTQGHEHWNALTTREGACVEMFHYFGDALWEKNGAQFPPGFRLGRVDPLEDAAVPAQQNNEVAAAASGEVATNATSSGAAPEADDIEQTEQASNAEEVEEAESGVNHDELLSKCFLMALRHTKDKELPLAVNQLYQTIRKLRPPNTSIDVKKTSWKKFLPFLRSRMEIGFCNISKDGEKLTLIVRNHEELIEFEPWVLTEESEGDMSARCLRVEHVWTVPERLKPLWNKDVITAEECAERVKIYADKKDLWATNNRKRIGPDDLLRHEGTVAVVSSKLLEDMKASHRVSESFGGETKVKIRPGPPPKVQVRTCTRKGHNVTLVSGLDKYGVDLHLLCGDLKHKLAASTAVEGSDIMVQGLWNETVSKLLADQWNVPLDAMDNKAKKALNEKKTKQATNIVKH
eukprot:GEMP01019619.1.p1 GENE.GEMP01019619.1~~GEMP01019619.1.p1  ORF type:complete len:543 (+),score=145.64 GEMP01019619.1:93-1721(+)